MKSLSLNQPHVIVMVGIPGSGKTFFAARFAETFKTPYVSLDTIRQFTGDEQAARAIAQNQLTELFKTGQAIILEGGTDARHERDELTKQAHKAGYQTLLVWVQTDPATSEFRALKSGLDEDEINDRIRHFSVPHEKEKPVVISGKHTYSTQLKIVLRKLSAPRTEATTQATVTTPPRMVSDIRRSR